MQKTDWNKIGKGIFIFLVLAILTYWSWQLRESLLHQYGGEWDRLGGFFRWVMGYVFLLGLLFLVGWLNFRGPYQWWQERGQRKWLYRSWMVLLLFVIYQLLQFGTGFQIELVEENLLIASLALLFIWGFTAIAALIRSRNQQTKLLQQQTAAELSALRAQLNPHFLFNALNTLYSQAIPLADESLAEHIQELSGILRFSLQQAQKEFVPVSEELTFLRRYIGLQKARLANPEQVKVDLSWDEKEGKIPPLLLLPFIENLFKYGLNSRNNGQAQLELLIEENVLRFYSENDLNLNNQPGTGKGIEQVRRRLDLRYPGSHKLEIIQHDGKFRVSLEIILYQFNKMMSETTQR